MKEEVSKYYECLAARDRRFDGIFFVGVKSTGIYCRPICTARTPSQANCRFYKSQAEAELNGFRPCLKCRPEIAPGSAPVDAKKRLARSALILIQEASCDEELSVKKLAESLGITDRHLRRITSTVYGVTPNELARTHRLLTAKRLLTETSVPLIEIAYAAGFRSVRSFNHQFKKHYDLTPSSIRNRSSFKTRSEETKERATIKIKLSYRPPFNLPMLLRFFRERALDGMEYVDEKQYCRAVMLKGKPGWYRVFEKDTNLYLEFSSNLIGSLSSIVNRVNRQFDLECHPLLIQESLAKDENLKEVIQSNPGLRIPGAFDQFEICVRAVAGQLISVKAARSICSRLVTSFGENISDPTTPLTRSFPSPYTVSRIEEQELKEACGLTLNKARTIIELARAIERGELRLVSNSNQNPLPIYKQLQKIKGIGPWTASYIALRTHLDPNAFPAGDLVVRKILGSDNIEELEQMSLNWQPWRSYATIYLWSKQEN